MIEPLIVKYLTDTLEMPVYAERPKTTSLPTSYILIENQGENDSNKIRSSLIAIQTHAPTLLGAMELCTKVNEAMNNIATLPEVFGCKLNSSYNFTDTSTKSYRYQSVYDVYY